MGASYTHTNRPTGTVITDTIYNGDHQNHIDNAIPALFDDYSASVSQMKSNTDPGGVGSESLATSLAGDLERLRFVLKRMGGGSEWYASPVNRVELWVLAPYSTMSVPGQWFDGITSNIAGFWRVPESWAGGNLTINLLRRASVSSGTASMTYNLFRSRVGVASVALQSSINIDFTPGATNTLQSNYTIVSTDVAAGDALIIDISRAGSAGGDTLSGTVILDGLFISYNGIAGRP